MTFSEAIHYFAIGNPVSKAVIGTTTSIVARASSFGNQTPVTSPSTIMASKAVSAIIPPLSQLSGGHYNFIRLAGFSGAAAVILGAIGSHKLNAVQDKNESKMIFETANRFHFFHSLMLLGVPLTRYPLVTGALVASGTVLFSGTLYYRAFTGDRRFAHLAPIGGTVLILAWLSLLL